MLGRRGDTTATKGINVVALLVAIVTSVAT